MPLTIVKCSVHGCDAQATTKIAAPWTYGRFSEMKTYGYACPSHSETVVEFAESRPRPKRLAEGETLGEVGLYDLEP